MDACMEVARLGADGVVRYEQRCGVKVAPGYLDDRAGGDDFTASSIPTTLAPAVSVYATTTTTTVAPVLPDQLAVTGGDPREVTGAGVMLILLGCVALRWRAKKAGMWR